MCRVLIIDDEQFSAETIKIILEDAGEAKADFATSFEGARELVKQSIKANKPYEVFLIDQRLGPGKDGIEVMQELRAINPDSDAIIFTGIEDTENGVRAYEAGAFRYLSKPFENRELLFLLKALKQWRKEQREHGWQKLFTSMMEEALRKTSFSEVGEIVVRFALKLGFSRAHLFWVPTQEDANPDNLMVGITCAGRGCIPHFSRSSADLKLYPLKQWFDLNRAKQAHEVTFFGSDEADKVQQQAKAMGYKWPKREIAFLPLWGSNRLLGELMLDHGQGEKALSKHELSLLNFFARQVAIVLENASLISREQRSVQETTIINQIGRQVTDRAAEETNLSELLDEVRKQVSDLMDVSNFSVVLLDPESGEMVTSLLYENGIRLGHLRPPASMKIERFLMNQDSGIFWSRDAPGQLQKNKLVIDGEIPTSCIGVQLRVGKKVTGGIVVKLYAGREHYTMRDYVLLSAVANQIAGAIKLIQVNEAEKQDAERLNVLRRAMMEMLRIAQENEDNLWLTTLTIATANFGTGFNRALLFLENDERTLLIGKTGVGANDPEEAQRAWENAVKRSYQFDDFLAELQTRKLQLTYFHDLASEITLPLNGDNNVFTQVLKAGHPVLVEEDRIKKKLPAEIWKKISPSTCAILPILTGNRAIGLVLVDNKHNGKPLSDNMLNRLQTVLSHAGLVWETLRQQSKSESLLDANYQIMGEARLQSLKDTLRNICKTAQKFTEADWVLIYPLKEGKKYEFDRENATYIGNLKSLENVIKEKPSPNGTSVHILKAGKLVVPDVDNKEVVIGDVHIAEHDFIKREHVRAMIGIAISDAQKDEPLGILYLDYRTPQNFSELDEHHAKSFASLAAVAIANERRDNEKRHQQRLKAALETAQIISNELDFDDMLLKVLENLKKFFKRTSMCVLTYDGNENALKFVPSTLKFYQVPKSKTPENRNFPLDGPSIASWTARESLAKGESVTINIPDVRKSPEYLIMIARNLSELCVSLLSSNHKLLGVLVLERANTYGFSDDDKALVETVASQLSLGMERARQSEQLSFKTTVAALTSWAADIAHDINNEAEEIQGYTYLIKELVQDNEQLVSYATKIEESAQRLFDAGPKSKQGKQAIPLNQAIKKFAGPLASQRDIQLEFSLCSNEYYIFVNPTDFRRVLQHLTRNADKAMRTMATKKITIVTRKAENNNVEILFRDYGPGVPEGVQLSILQKSVTTKQSGGFGLLLTRQFVEDMGGTIRLLPSEPGMGAIFSIKLPITKFDDDATIE
jgi:GAF domain-containing protein/CheY-like chemotaxis protein